MIDPRAPQRRRRAPERLLRLAALRAENPAEALAACLSLGVGFEDLGAFQADRGMTDEAAAALRPGLEVLRSETSTFIARPERWQALRDEVEATLSAFHADNPELPGLAGERLRLSLGLPKPLWVAVRERLIAEKRVAPQGHWLHLPGHVAELGTEDRRLAGLIVPRIAGDRFRPPRVRDIGKDADLEEAGVRRACKALARSGTLIEVARDHFFLRATVAEMAEIARRLTEGGADRLFSAADFRDELDNGRKVAVQILEYFDRHGLTRRDGDLRRVVKSPDSVFGAIVDRTV